MNRENIGRGTYRHVAPLGANNHNGNAQKKPWDYNVTVAIPHLNTPEPLELIIQLMRLQTERPYIVIVDTGSPPSVQARLEAMRDEDVEIHYMACHGYRHTSEPVASALDFAQAVCQSKLLLHAHSDCFPRRIDLIESLARTCNANTPAIGYRMSPRDWLTTEWEWMVGHTLLMLYMPSIHRVGATWSFQRTYYAYHYPIGLMNGWPDTETGFNHALRDAGIKPVFVGYDRNYEHQIDDNIDHARSYVGSKVYLGNYFKKAQQWMDEAMRDAAQRIKDWSQDPPLTYVPNAQNPYASPDYFKTDAEVR